MIRRLGLAVLALAVSAALLAGTGRRPVAPDVPGRLDDGEFWRLIQSTSEPDGYFDSDNLVSNEDTFQTIIPDLQRIVPSGHVYLGVGPDQNFTYIAAVAPRLAFILDVRRGNLQVHLMYKALFELSADRVEFASRLFGRARPEGVGAHSTAEQLLSAFAAQPADRQTRDRTLREIADVLQVRHRFALDPGDLPAIARVYDQFSSSGPRLRFVSSRPGSWYPSFQDIHTSTDAAGLAHSYLSTEARFQQIKALEEANAIVPIVGNFAGPKALRAIGAYVQAHDATIGTFYTSNVERYLFQDGLWKTFVDNVSALPLTGSSTFIRSCFDSCSSFGQSRSVSLLDSIPELLQDVRAGRISTYGDVLAHARRR